MGRQLTISVKGKLLGDAETFYADLTDRVQSFNYQSTAFGGYNSASVSFAASVAEISQWLQDALCRDLTFYGPALDVLWNGFVNQIQVSAGGRATTYGPVLDIGNAIVSEYAPVDVNLTLPSVGVSTLSSWGNDTESQARYGTWQKVFTAGARDPDEVDDLVNRWLAQMATPNTSHNLSSQGQSVSVTLMAVGYFQALKSTIYSNESNGLVNASTKVEDLLDAETNGLLSSTNADIDTNVLTVSEYDNSNRTLLDALTSVVTLGDASANRWLFGVYAGRKAIYQEAPSEVEYLFSSADFASGVSTLTYATVEPWAVKPGKWLFDPDFLVGKVPAGTPTREDPRMLFIETVQYSSPMTLTINGAPLDVLAQKLAQVTMTGGLT